MEKADVLEMTVTYLRAMHRKDSGIEGKRLWSFSWLSIIKERTRFQNIAMSATIGKKHQFATILSAWFILYEKNKNASQDFSHVTILDILRLETTWTYKWWCSALVPR